MVLGLRLRTFAAVLFAAVAWVNTAPAQPVVPSSIVFQAGDDGYHTYRIPAIIRTPKGSLIAFCEGRKVSSSDAGDIDLLMKRSDDNGGSWSRQLILHEEGDDAEITIGNPCPVVDTKAGVIWLAFTRNNARGFVMSSKDDGETWGEPFEITDALRAFHFEWTRLGTGPVNGIQMTTGRLVLPVWLNDRIGENYRSAAIYSEDAGKTWRAGGIVPPMLPGCNECVIVEAAPGHLYMNLRNKHSDHRRGIAWSDDGGISWTEPQLDGALIDPICQGSGLRMNGPDSMLFANAASEKRERILVRKTSDGGATWGDVTLLWPGAGAYSCLVALGDGDYGCLFEAGEKSPYESIRFTRFSVE